MVSGSAMAGSPQQFCLRWNNHQSNIVTVFEQLLHSGAFVDVTLAVEGMSIKAHKVVLSACSPYFQAVLASHPDKHPIVILKDVRYEDMRDLLDFMYRGEVSVDQDNLSGFLRVAESLRIKGLTEVNEKKRMETNISPYLMSPNVQQQNSTPPGVISPSTIISHSDLTSLKRPPLSPTGSYGSNKRRRGRPPKISGEESEGETIPTNASQGASSVDGEESRTDNDVGKDVKIEIEEFGKEDLSDQLKDKEGRNSDSAGPSAENHAKDDIKIPKEEPENTRESPGSEWTPALIPVQTTPAGPVKRPRGRPPRVPRQPQDPSKWPPLLPKPSKLTVEVSRTKVSVARTSSDSTSSGTLSNTSAGSGPSMSSLLLTPTVSVLPTSMSVSSFDLASSNISSVSGSNMNCPFPIELRDLSSVGLPGGVLPLSVELGVGPGEIENIGELGIRGTEQVAQNVQEMTEGVQMGIKVRGLDLMRYGRLENGVYRCSECERLQIVKTFKTSYSFQRHAYLYHEGSPKRFPCPVCGKEFSRPDKRKSHLKEKHGLFQTDNTENLSEAQ